MADRREDFSEQSSSSSRPRTGHRFHRHVQRENSQGTSVSTPVVNPTQAMAVESEQEQNAIFKAQLLSVMDAFQKMTENPRFA